jgi:hypothetical protein
VNGGAGSTTLNSCRDGGSCTEDRSLKTPLPMSGLSARSLRESIVASALADVEQRLRAVRCPIDGQALTKVHVGSDGSPAEIDGCCGALTEARRLLEN